MLLLIAVGCIRFTAPGGETGAGETGDTDTSAPNPVDAPRVVWGDLHNHTNFSHDGCEDPEGMCGPDEEKPAELTFTRASANGLGFAALTDHAEFTTYQGPEDTAPLDIWEESKALVEAAEGTGTFGLLGYEWTSTCTGDGLPADYQAMHRTVVLEEIDGCASWRIPSCHSEGTITYGRETYGYSPIDPTVSPEDLLAALQAVPDTEGCAPTRWVAFFHHVAQDRPAWVDWSKVDPEALGDTVVEIASEHGSSECASQDSEGCDWHFSENHHVPEGSIQAMLQAGHRLGFVGGTDNHQDDPGLVLRAGDGGGYVRDLANAGSDTPYHTQFAEGTLTGALTDEESFDRGDLFDALEARHTVVASWPAEGLVVFATGADGVRYLPGDDVPVAAIPLVLTVELDDPTVGADWWAELVAPDGNVTPVTTGSTVELPAGTPLYVRIRAGSDQHRVFASPFFAE